MTKFLVIGNGFLGKKLASDLNCPAVDLETPIPIDITDVMSIRQVMKHYKPDVVIHTAAMTNVDACEKEPNLSQKVNVEGTRHVYNYCDAYNIKMVFISTDFVFGGNSGDYKEEDIPNPQSIYASNKVDGEVIVMQNPDNLILRTSTLYGFNDIEDKMTFPTWVKKVCDMKQKVKIVHDQTTCPTLIDNISTAILKLISKDCSGIYHCVGSQALDRWKYAITVADVFECDFALKRITCVDSKSLNQDAKRPTNSSLCIDKLRQEGIEMFDVETGLKVMKKQMEVDKCSRVKTAGKKCQQ